MGVNSLPKTVTRQRRDCDLNPGPSAPESSTLTTRLSSHVKLKVIARRDDMPPPIAADLGPCVDGSAVRTALVAWRSAYV